MNESAKLAEQILILRCQIGDERAFAELIERYGRTLKYFISRLLDNNEAVEDIFQDTWLTVFRKIHGLKDIDAFPTWLYRIARNKVYQRLRREKIFFRLDEKTAAPDYADDNNFSAEDAEKVHRVLEKLNPAHKEVLMLRFLEQMPYDQIAKVINCNAGTVKSRIYYAKLALKKEMER